MKDMVNKSLKDAGRACARTTRKKGNLQHVKAFSQLHLYSDLTGMPNDLTDPLLLQCAL